MRLGRRPLALPAVVALVLLAACGTSADVHTTRADPIGSAPLPTDEPTATTGPSTTDPDTTGPEATDGGQSSLEWGTCDDPSVDDPNLQCATITVPLDYDNPTGATIDLALVRVPASG